MKTTTIYLKGMHCNACKLLVEKTLIQLPAIQAVDANVRKGQVRLKYAGKLDMDEVIALIRANGYEVVDTPPHRPRLSTNINDYKILLISLLSFLFLYWILQQTGTATRFDIQADTPSLGMVLLIGLTAGFSSCMAVIGGLVLAISSKWNLQHTEKSFGKKLLPHFRFNAGRLVGFGVLGGVLGMFGSIVSLSPVSLAVMTLLVGVVMLLLGVNLTGISPKVSGFSISLPTFRLFSLKSGSLFGRLSRFE
jgi:copper chaperone CopZ